MRARRSNVVSRPTATKPPSSSSSFSLAPGAASNHVPCKKRRNTNGFSGCRARGSLEARCSLAESYLGGKRAKEFFLPSIPYLREMRFRRFSPPFAVSIRFRRLFVKWHMKMTASWTSFDVSSASRLTTWAPLVQSDAQMRTNSEDGEIRPNR